MNTKYKISILIVILIWLTVLVYYFARTPWHIRSHDTYSHTEYTEFIAKEHRLPYKNEIFQYYQPPLYYLICSFLPNAGASRSTEERLVHIQYARLMSISFGLFSILLIFWFLSNVTENLLNKVIVVLFIATNPKFVFVFSTYNNDSLINLLCICIVLLSYKLYSKWSNNYAWLLLMVTTAALYTKYASLITIGSLLTIYSIDLIRKKGPKDNMLSIAKVLLLSSVLLLPWAILHNYKSTKQLFPTILKIDGTIFNYERYKNIVGMVFKIPGLQRTSPDYKHEWDEPFVYSEWLGDINPVTKRYDYFGFQFVTSVIGEYKYLSPNVNNIWYLLWIHLFLYVIALIQMVPSEVRRFCFLMIIFSFLIELIFLMPIYIFLPNPSPDYRYIAWQWVCWAALYSTALASTKEKLWGFLLKSVFIAGIFLHIYVLLTAETTI